MDTKRENPLFIYQRNTDARYRAYVYASFKYAWYYISRW